VRERPRASRTHSRRRAGAARRNRALPARRSIDAAEIRMPQAFLVGALLDANRAQWSQHEPTRVARSQRDVLADDFPRRKKILHNFPIGRARPLRDGRE
jgi:hypothetical protein